MSFLRFSVFIFLMGSSFFANALTIDLSVDTQEATFLPGSGSFADTWELEVLTGKIVDVNFSAVNISFASIDLNIANFDVTNTSNGFFATSLTEGLYTFLVIGDVTGASGGVYTVSTSVSQIPLPAAAWLFGSAFIGLISFGRRRIALPA
jgi:hypothetical protein